LPAAIEKHCSLAMGLIERSLASPESAITTAALIKILSRRKMG
jgi:hypothetical protein